MMKRMSTHLREENYEHVLMCLICRSLFDDNDHQPKFLPCHHTFCKDCLREYVKQMGDEIECPSCRKIATIPAAGVTALQTNFYVKYIQGLVQNSYGGDCCSASECTKHQNNPLTFFCKTCQLSICNKCCVATRVVTEDDAGKERASSCEKHDKVPLTTITEECHQKLDKNFTKANALIESKKVESEAILRGLSAEKDQSLLKIESTFEQHVHALSRRATLLKNKVIDIYNEHVSKIESDLEEISTAMTCIVSLKEYHEQKISKAEFSESEKGMLELQDVFDNISERIVPMENHIIYEDKHGVDKFKVTVKDLGRVRNNRPTIPRTEPEGGRDERSQSVSSSVGNTPMQASESSPLHTSGACGSDQTFSCKDPSCDKLTTSFHAMICDTTLGLVDEGDGETREDGNNAPSSDTKAVKAPSSASLMTTDTNANKSNTDHRSDPNSNQSVLFDGSMAVRPKTLETTVKIKKVKVTPSVKPVKVKHLSAVKQNYLLQNFLDHGSNQNEHGLVRHPQILRREDVAGLPDLEALKKTDKMYHHLVYTSYDEEELLKELKVNKTALTDPNASFMARMSESDSWMTASSVEDLELSTSDEQQLQLSTL